MQRHIHLFENIETFKGKILPYDDIGLLNCHDILGISKDEIMYILAELGDEVKSFRYYVSSSTVANRYFFHTLVASYRFDPEYHDEAVLKAGDIVKRLDDMGIDAERDFPYNAMRGGSIKIPLKESFGIAFRLSDVEKQEFDECMSTVIDNPDMPVDSSFYKTIHVDGDIVTFGYKAFYAFLRSHDKLYQLGVAVENINQKVTGGADIE